VEGSEAGEVSGSGLDRTLTFFGAAEAVSASALLYTLIANCREQGIDAERYFEEALRRMVSVKPSAVRQRLAIRSASPTPQV